MKTGKNKKMNFLSATSIGVGAMIGAGIFALIGISVEIAGKFAYISFIIAGIIAFFTSYSVSKLAVAFPSKGGPVEYLNQGFRRGIFAGALNLIMWLGYIIVNSLYARAFGEYGAVLFNNSDSKMFIHLLSSLVVVVFIGINFMGANWVGKLELFIVLIKVLVLLGFSMAGLSNIASADFLITKTPNISGIILASGVIFMSFEGFGLVANTAEDIRHPRKNLPRALSLSIVIVLFIYVLVTIAVVGNLSISEIIKSKEYVLAEAAKPILGSLGFTIMGIAALFSTSSAINATIYGPVNMIQETAKANQFPKVFTKPLFGHHSGHALIATGIIIVLISNFLNLEDIAEVGSLIFLLVYTTINIANFRLRKKTKSKAVIIIFGTTGTFFAFCVLIYYQWIGSKYSSLIVFLGLILFSLLFEFLQQKTKHRIDSSKEK